MVKFSTFLITCLMLTFMMMNPASAASFSDVDKSYRFHDEIEKLNDQGVIQGYTDGTFCPYQTVTRGEAALFLGRALKLSPTESSTFKDISSSVVDRYVQAGQKVGFINGYSDGTFRPSDEVTRGELAIFLENAFELEHHSVDLSSFSDVSPQMNAYHAIMILAEREITAGYPDGSFKPNKPVTRGEFAAMLVNASNAEKINYTETTGYIIWRDESSLWLISHLSQEEIEQIDIEGKTRKELSELSDNFNQKGIIFSLDEIDESIVSKLEVGQQVMVTYKGTLQTSAPALGSALDVIPITWEEVNGYVVERTEDHGKEIMLIVEGISQKEALEKTPKEILSIDYENAIWLTNDSIDFQDIQKGDQVTAWWDRGKPHQEPSILTVPAEKMDIIRD